MKKAQTFEDLEKKIIELELENQQQNQKLSELETSSQIFSNIFKQNPLALSIAKLSDLKFIEINKEFEKVFGYTEKEAVGKTLDELKILSKKNSGVNLKKRSNGNGLHNVEIECVRKNKEEFPALLYTQRIEIDGETCVVSTLKDLTNERKLEKELRQSQKMESIGTLASGIAHDFNNILSVILGHSQLVQCDLPESSKYKENINQIQKAGIRATELVKQILQFSRNSEKEYTAFKPELVTKEAIKLIKSTFPTTLRIKGSIEENCGSILGDETQIYEILMNLTTNSLHAMENKKTGEAHGNLEILLKSENILETKHLETQILPKGKYIKLTIKDTGCGIDEKMKSKVFDPYFTTKAENKGTGLGLSVVHGIVKSHNGIMLLNSQKHKGTEFQIYFPKTENIETNILTPEVEQRYIQQTQKRRLLVIDDDIDLLNLNAQVLQNQGYQVDSFTDSSEAYQVYQENPTNYDMVITDQTMPKFTGIGLIKAIREISQIPTLLLTGLKDEINQEQIKNLNITLESKPLDNVKLLTIIRDEIDKSTPRHTF